MSRTRPDRLTVSGGWQGSALPNSLLNKLTIALGLSPQCQALKLQNWGLPSDAHSGLFCKTHTPGVNLTPVKCLLSQCFGVVFAQLFFLSNEAIAGPLINPSFHPG